LHIRQKKLVWYGTHKGVSFEINNWEIDGKGYVPNRDMWSFYLFISQSRIPDQELANNMWLDIKDNGKSQYYDSDTCWLANLRWHHGASFYKKISGFDNTEKIIQIAK